MPVYGSKQPRINRPIGNHRFPRMNPGDSFTIRILTDCREEGPYGGVPAYDVHIIPSPYRAGDKDIVPCLEGHASGTCATIVMPDGTRLHDLPKRQMAVVCLWNYRDRQIQILDLGEEMWKVVDKLGKSQSWGEIRGFDLEISCIDIQAGNIRKKRLLQPGPNRNPLATEVQTYVATYLAKMEQEEMWPKVTPDVVAAFVGGHIAGPSESAVHPPIPSGLTPSPLGPGPGGMTLPEPPIPPGPANMMSSNPIPPPWEDQ